MMFAFITSLITCSMNPETVVTFTHGHFNQVVFAVIGYLLLVQEIDAR